MLPLANLYYSRCVTFSSSDKKKILISTALVLILSLVFFSFSIFKVPQTVYHLATQDTSDTLSVEIINQNPQFNFSKTPLASSSFFTNELKNFFNSYEFDTIRIIITQNPQRHKYFWIVDGKNREYASYDITESELANGTIEISLYYDSTIVKRFWKEEVLADSAELLVFNSMVLLKRYYLRILEPVTHDEAEELHQNAKNKRNSQWFIVSYQ